MSTAEQVHPDINALRGYLLGKLDALASREIDRHVEQCPHCIDRCDQINDDDDVIALMRAVQSKSSSGLTSRSGNGSSRRLEENTSIASKLAALSRANRRPKIPGYEIQKELGHGGMGVVYQARQTQLNRTVALKTLPPDAAARPDLILRLEREAQVLARLQHPNILQIFEVGEHEGCGYVALEFVDGRDLHEHLGDRPLSPSEAAEHVVVLADAIRSAHQLGIIHRDLKPRNILIDNAGQIKIDDFGLAKVLDSDSEQTRSGMFLGTPAYMAPEQVRGGSQDLSAAADVYGLGTILYRCLTARGPFDGESTATTLHRIIHTQPISPRSISSRIPRDLETICLKCLEKEPSQRYSSAAGLAEDLRRFLRGDAIQARPVQTAEHVWRWSRRNKLLAAALVLILTMFVGGAFHFWLNGHRLARLAHEREVQADRALNLQRQAETARDVAEGERNKALGGQYVAEVSSASRIRNSLDGVGGVADAIQRWQRDEYHPGNDFRGWEWYFLASEKVQPTRTLNSFPRASAARWSPDGQTLLSSGPELLLWSTQDWSYQRVDFNKLGRVARIDWSPNGQQVALIGRNAAKKWELWVLHLASGNSIRIDCGDAYACSAWNRDGSKIAMGGGKQNIAVYDSTTGRMLETFSQAGPVRSVSWHPDGTKLAFVVNDKLVQIRDLTGGSSDPIQAHTGSIEWITWSSDGKRLATASADRTIKIWRSSAALEHQLNGHNDQIGVLRWSPDGQLLASCSNDFTVRVWDAASGKQVRCFIGHSNVTSDVDWSPSGDQLISASFDGTIRFWNIREPTNSELLFGYNNFKYPAVCVAWSPDGRYFVSGDDYQLILCDANTHREIHRHHWGYFEEYRGAKTNYGPPRPLSVRLRAVRWRNDSKRVLIAFGDRVALYDTATQDRIWTINLQSGAAVDVCWSRDNKRFYSAAKDNAIRAWDADSGDFLFELTRHTDRVRAIDMSVDGYLASGSWDKTIRIWNAQTGDEIRVLNHHEDEICEVSWNPDGTRLASGGKNGELYVWDPSTAKVESTLRGHTRRISSVCWSPDGTRLASASADGTIRIWEPASGAELCVLADHDGHVNCVHWSPDGLKLLSASSDNTVRIWDATRAYEREQSCDSLMRRNGAE